MATSRVYSAKITIRNHGNVSSRSCLSAIVLSTNNIISTLDPVLASISTPVLAVDRSYVTTRSFRMPASTPAGTCYLGGFADRSGLGRRARQQQQHARRAHHVCARPASESAGDPRRKFGLYADRRAWPSPLRRALTTTAW